MKYAIISIFYPKSISQKERQTMTVCNKSFEISSSFSKKLTINFDGGNITSDGGMLLLSRIDQKLGVSDLVSDAITDQRTPSKITHSLSHLVKQKIYQLASGYEDDNDANILRIDPALKTAAGKLPEKDTDLASQPTFCRFENSITKKDIKKLLFALLECYIRQKLQDGIPDQIVIDIDPTDDPVHGNQEYGLFHGYYWQVMYYPLLMFDGESGALISAFLRPGTYHASHGADSLLKIILAKLKTVFPQTQFIIRGDCGFGVPKMYDFCETKGKCNYILGISGNSRLQSMVQMEKEEVKKLFESTGEAQKVFKTFFYKAEKWEIHRRIIAKIEHNHHGSNVRFLVTNIDFDSAESGYDYYTQRGECENRIKELKNDLFMDRLSCHRYLANFFRLLLSSFAYVIMHELKRELKNTKYENIQFKTIRLKLLKIGARVKETSRRIWFSFSSSYVDKDIFLKLIRESG